MSACAKIRYLSRRNARKHAARQLRPNGKPEAYKCGDCGFWHLTTTQDAARKEFFRSRERSSQ